MMKKLMSLLLVILTAIVLVGCVHKHEYVEKVVAPTCTENGYTEYTCECGDVYRDNEVEKTGHSFGEWTVTKEATETEEGIKERTCSVCSEKESEKIAKKEHEHTEEVIPAVDATCTETGLTEGKKCSACGEILVEQEEVAALGHTEEVIPAVAPNCTNKGLTEGKTLYFQRYEKVFCKNCKLL